MATSDAKPATWWHYQWRWKDERGNRGSQSIGNPAGIGRGIYPGIDCGRLPMINRKSSPAVYGRMVRTEYERAQEAERRAHERERFALTVLCLTALFIFAKIVGR
jgi:hypothetical protein